MNHSGAPITLHFAHANGFPFGSYRALFAHLPKHFNAIGVDKFGHNPAYPVQRGWHNLVEEMVAYVKDHSEGPVYAVGHSFGAVLSYMAVCRYPQHFRGLIMLDPPLVTGITRIVAGLIRGTPLYDKLTPAGKSAVRNTQWPKDTNLVAYFKGKGLFRGMHQQCIEDYVASATELRGDTHHLTFDYRVETDIFRTVPLDIHRHYGQLKRPALLLTGEKTEVSVPALMRPFVKRNPIKHEVFPRGGHLFPMQQPEGVAARLAEVIQQWAEGERDQ